MTAKFLLLSLALVLSLGAAPAPIEPNEAKPTAIGGLEFSLVTQAKWIFPELPTNGGAERRITLQLRITNPGSQAILFPVIDTFRPILRGPDGMEVEFLARTEKWAGDDPPAVLLQPGRGYALPLRARMLLGHDAPGQAAKPNVQLTTARTSYTTKPVLTPGDYALAMELFPSKSPLEKEGKNPWVLWSAKGKMDAVGFRIVADSTGKPSTEAGGAQR